MSFLSLTAFTQPRRSTAFRLLRFGRCMEIVYCLSWKRDGLLILLSLVSGVGLFNYRLTLPIVAPADGNCENACLLTFYAGWL